VPAVSPGAAGGALAAAAGATGAGAGTGVASVAGCSRKGTSCAESDASEIWRSASA
jgi:hypothetical protein